MDLKHAFNDFVNQYVIEADTPQAVPDPNAKMRQAPIGVPNAASTGLAASVLAGQFLQPLRDKIKTGARYSALDQFVSATDALTEFIPDEAQRFRAAAKQLAKANIQASEIEAAATEMMNLLSTEVTTFSQVVQSQTTEAIQRGTDVDGINAHIEQLQQQITSLTMQRDTITNDIVARKQKISAAQDGFNGAVSLIRKENEEFLRKLKLYVGTK